MPPDYTRRQQMAIIRQQKIQDHARENGPAADPIRSRRMKYLVKAFVYYGGDMEAMKADMPQEELEKFALEDPWWEKTFDRLAQQMLEEGLLLNLVEMGMAKNAQTLPASKTVLPALNKHRYNLGVQKQETANEGVAEFLKIASTKSIPKAELLQIIINHDPTFIQNAPQGLENLSLEQAVEIEAARGNLIENHAIQEDEDLR